MLVGEDWHRGKTSLTTKVRTGISKVLSRGTLKLFEVPNKLVLLGNILWDRLKCIPGDPFEIS